MTTDSTPNSTTEPLDLDDQLSDLLGRIDEACAEVEERLREHDEDPATLDLEAALALGVAVDDVGQVAAPTNTTDAAIEPEPEPEPEPETELKAEPEAASESDAAPEPDTAGQAEVEEAEAEREPEAEVKPEAEIETEPDSESETGSEPEPASVADAEPEAVSVPEPEPEPAPQAATEPEAPGGDEGDEFDLGALIDDAVTRSAEGVDEQTSEVVAKLDEELAERADNAALDVDQPVETEPEPAAELLGDASELPASDTNDDDQTAPDSSAEPNAEPEPVGEAPDESAAAFAASDPPAPEVEEAWPDLDDEPQSNDETAAQAEAETPPAPEPEPAPAANAEPDTKSKPEPKPAAKPPTPAKAPKPSKASKPSKPGKTAKPAKAAKPVKAASLQPAAATSTSDKAGGRSIKQLGPWIIDKAKDWTPKVTAWFIATGRRLAPKLAPAALTTSRAISKPLERKPKALRDMIGWIALGSLFWGGCVWVVVLFFRKPVIPQAATPPAALITPEAVPGPTPGTTPMPSASGVSLGE